MATRPSETKVSWKGPLFTFSIAESVDRTKGILRRWNVFSSGKRSTFGRLLKGKWLWDELARDEQKIFWSLGEVLSDKVFFACLKAFANGTPKKLIRERLKTCPFEINFISRQQYVSLKGRVHYSLQLEEVSLRRTPKYSGYTRHHKDQGTLGTSRDYEIVSDLLATPESVDEELLLTWLTVGEFSLFSGDVILRPDETQLGRNGVITKSITYELPEILDELG